MKAEKIEYIENDVEYVLLRSGIYVGSTDKNQIETYLPEEEKFVKKSIEYVPAFLKLFDEVISNSVDEAIKTNFRFGNKIEVTINESGSISIADNGRGISSEIEENTRLPQAVVALTKLKAGSNFKKESSSIGQNGVGVSLVNIFSKHFHCETSDSVNKTVLTCTDNMSHSEWSQRKSSKQYTTITFLPDYERLKMDGMDATHYSLIEKRVVNLAFCYPEISFSINGKKIPKRSLKQYIQLFDENALIFSESDKNVDVAIVPFQKEYEMISFVNGVDTTKHGQHVTVFNALLNKFIKDNKKTKDIPLNQFLSNSKVFVIVKGMKNPAFSAQIKDELTNSYSEVKEYFNAQSIEKLLSSMLRNKEFLSYVQDYSETIQRLNERKDLTKEEKSLKKHKVAKFLSPISSKTEFCNFYLCEGDSAIAQLINVRNNFTAGYPLKGKVINPRTSSPKKLIENQNIKDLIHLLGLRISDPGIENFKYKNIYLLADADCFEENTKVLTIGGNKKLKEIEYGDKVLTHSGEYKDVIRIIQKKKTECIKIKLGVDYIFVSKNHQFPVIRDGKIQIVMAEDIKYTDYILRKKS